MSLFTHRSRNLGVGPKLHRAAKRKAMLAAFADALAEGARPEDAAVELGYAPSYGRVLLGEIRAALGEQAR